MAGLREKGKARRRAEVIATAATLWRAHGVEDVSLIDIAAAAEVSNQTVYNLIGGVDALKVAIIEALLARLEQAVADTSAVGVDRSIHRARTSAALFIADPDLYRSILVSIPQALFSGARLPWDGSSFQREALEEAHGLGQLAAGIDFEPLSWQIHIQFLGGLLAWACGTLDDAGFQRAAELAALAPLAACSTSMVRARLTDRLRDLLTAPGLERKAGASS